MKEVTRIYIAKTSYDIEIAAKKKLESYIEDLTAYAEDDNMLEDIEIRITELLEQRGVLASGMIHLEDVVAVREILGEPRDFSGDGDIAVGIEHEERDAESSRKLFRDIDHAAVGGVLAGLANYLKINVAWARIAFIVLIFISFGVALFIYVLLWIIIPAAVTATEKLQMRGEPVTLVTIRRFNESSDNSISTKQRLELRRRGFGVAIGILGILGTVAALVLTLAGIGIWMMGPMWGLTLSYQWVVLGLAVASGLFLAILGIIMSHAGFVAKVTKKTVIAGIIVIVAGVLTFSSAVGIVGIQAWRQNEEIQQSTKERAVTLPTNFSKTKKLIVNAPNTMVDYRVSQDMRAAVTSIPGVTAQVVYENEQAIVTMSAAREGDMFVTTPYLVIYGPTLESIEVKSGTMQYAGMTQDLAVSLGTTANMSVTGNYGTLSVQLDKDATFSADGASVVNTELTMEPYASGTLGNIRSLTVTQPSACPNDSRANLSVQSVAEGKMTYNGSQFGIGALHQTSCGSVTFGSPDEE